jgi:hypothetical protein
MERKLAAAFWILRNSQIFEKIGEGGVLGGVKKLYGAVSKGAKTTGAELTAMGSPLLGTAASLAPVAALAYGGKKVYESRPVQQAIANHRQRQYEKQLAQQGY